MNAVLGRAPGPCGDVGDGAHAEVEPTRASTLASADGRPPPRLPSDAAAAAAAAVASGELVASLGAADSCAAQDESFCDGSTNSGRQLDICGVCGGSSFPPFVTSQAECVESGAGIARIR